MAQHAQVNITCCKMHSILLGVYPNSPMKDSPCLLFRLIWKVVNYFFQLKVKFPIRGQVIFINVDFLWRLWLFLFWFVLIMLFVVLLLTSIKINTSSIFFFFLELWFLAGLQILLHFIFMNLFRHMLLTF